ncbi:MAG: hypothetical protein AAF658_06510, partial [Myxococcota bacterium]
LDTPDPASFTFYTYGFDAVLDAGGVAGLSVDDLAVDVVNGEIQVALRLRAEEVGINGLFIGSQGDNFENLVPLGTTPVGIEYSNQRLFQLEQSGSAGWQVTADPDENGNSVTIPILGLGDTVEQFQIVRDESLPFFDAGTLNIAIASEGSFHIWLDVPEDVSNICTSAAPACAQTETPLSACEAGSPSAVTLLELNQLGADDEVSPELLVGCDTGAFEIWNISEPLAPTMLAQTQATSLKGDPTITALTGFPSERGDHEVMALLPGAETILIFDITESAAMITVAEGPRIQEYSNTAILDPATGVASSELEMVAELSVRAPTGGVCTFNSDTDAPVSDPVAESARLRDLRLSGGACANSTELTVEALEFDVDLVTRDCQPDIGASELVSTPGACP